MRLESCSTVCNPVDYSLPGSSVHGILQARVLEWVAVPFSKGFSQPRDRTWLSCIASRFFCFGFPTAGPQWAFKPSLAIKSQSRCGQSLRQRPCWSGWKEGLGKAGTDVGGCPGVEGTPTSLLPLATLELICRLGAAVHQWSWQAHPGADYILAFPLLLVALVLYLS